MTVILRTINILSIFVHNPFRRLILSVSRLPENLKVFFNYLFFYYFSILINIREIQETIWLRSDRKAGKPGLNRRDPSPEHVEQIIPGRFRWRGRALTRFAPLKGGITGQFMYLSRPGARIPGAQKRHARCRRGSGESFMTSNERGCLCMRLITVVYAVFGHLERLSNRDATEARILGPRALVIIANYGRGRRLKAIFACMRGIHAIRPESRDQKNARHRIARCLVIHKAEARIPSGSSGSRISASREGGKR